MATISCRWVSAAPWDDDPGSSQLPFPRVTCVALKAPECAVSLLPAKPTPQKWPPTTEFLHFLPLCSFPVSPDSAHSTWGFFGFVFFSQKTEHIFLRSGEKSVSQRSENSWCCLTFLFVCLTDNKRENRRLPGEQLLGGTEASRGPLNWVWMWIAWNGFYLLLCCELTWVLRAASPQLAGAETTLEGS